MKLPRLRLPEWWPAFWPAVLIIAGATLTLLHQLASLAPRLSPTEQTNVSLTRHLPDLLAGSAPIPLRLLEWASLHLPVLSEMLRVRLPSVLIGVLSLIILAYIMQRWYARRSMVFGLLLIASSAWFMHVSRFAGLEVEYFAATPALLAVHLLLHDHEDNRLVWFIWLVVNTLLLFIPGMFWFVILSAAWQWRAIFHALSGLYIWQYVVSALLPLAAIGWLAYDVVVHRSLLLPILGLPTSLTALRGLPQSLLHTLELFVYAGPNRPELWLGRLPLLDTFIIVAFAAGAYFYARHPFAARSQLLASYIVLGVLLISLGGGVGISVVMPLIYLVAVAGIAYVLHFWLRIFPRNPLARFFGIGLITLLVALSCYYNLTQYFVAWPHNTEVAQVYRSGH